MTRTYRKRNVQRKSLGRKTGRTRKSKKASGKGFEVQLPLQREELAEMLEDALHSFAVEVGLLLAEKMLQDEVTRLCGRRYPRQPGRELTRYGRQPGVITLAGQKLPVEKPRVRHYDRALQGLKTTARWLDRISPRTAASLREGMEETLTVIRLGVPELLRKTLSSTNPIESAFDTTQKVTARVKRWREGDMRERWPTAGLLRAKSKSRRVKGYRQIPQLIASLDAQLLDARRRAG